MIKKLSIIIVAPISILLLFFWFKPLVLGDTLVSIQMNLSGVKRHYTNGVEYYERNHCNKTSQCQCTLFVHGLGDQVSSWANVLSQSKSKWIKSLHIFAINLPGSRNTQPLDDITQYHVSNQAKWLANFIDNNIECKTSEWIVVGNSFGGWISSYLVLNKLLPIKAIAFENSAGLNIPYKHFIDNYISPTYKTARQVHKMAYHKPFIFHQNVYEALAVRSIKMPVREALEQIESNPPFLEKDLGKIKIPSLVLWGLSDQLFPEYVADRFHLLLPNSQISKINECGHLPHKGCSDKFTSSFNNFLETIP